MPLPNAKFELGQACSTHGALGALEDNKIPPIVILARHVSGDWGDASDNLKALNDAALIANPDNGEYDRVWSVYILPDGQKVWCITEWDRSCTTILLPTDY